MHLEVLNTFNDYHFNRSRNMWSLAEVPMLPMSMYDLQTGTRKGVTLHDNPSLYEDDGYVTMIFAISPTGLKTSPMFMIRKPYLRGKWFFPLDGTVYFGEGIVSELTSSAWVPRNASVHCLKGTELGKDDMSALLRHLNREIRACRRNRGRNVVHLVTGKCIGRIQFHLVD